MIRMYFGSPGCGKSTLLSRIAFMESKNYDFIFTNGDCSLCHKINVQDLADFTVPPKSLILIDESGIEFNNRSFKTFKKGLIEFFKKYRHEECDIFLFSQSWEDVDITIRRLTDEIYHLKKIGSFTLIRRIYKKVGMDEIQGQIIDKYKFGSIFGLHNFQLLFRPMYYKYFDSYEKLNRDIIPYQEQIYCLTKKEYRIKRIIHKYLKWLILAIVFIIFFL